MEKINHSLPNRPVLNQQTTSRHQRESWLQIFIPAIAGLLLLGAVLILAVVPGAAASRNAADVAIIFLLSLTYLPLLIVAAVILAVLVGVSKVYQVLPNYTRLAQGFSAKLQYQVRLYADKAVDPFVAMQCWKAAVQEGVSQTRRSFRLRLKP